MAIISLLDIAKRGLLAQETALGVVGQNISNVNTPGYTRQVTELESDPSTPTAGGVLVGTGVHVGAVEAVLDPILQQRLLRAQADTQHDAALHDRLAALATSLSDVSDPSLASAVNDFFDAADALARNPGGLAERESLLGKANLVASELNRRSSFVAGQQRDADDRYVNVVKQANADLGHLARLNASISAAEIGGQRANELRDQRQAVLSDLSGLLGTTAAENEDGSVTVSAANGAVLVAEGSVVHSVAVRAQGTGLDGASLHEIGLVDTAGAFIAVPGAFPGGEIGALATVRDGQLVTASGTLDTFAGALVGEVNRVQTNGGAGAIDLDGHSTANTPFFTGTDAKTIAVALSGANAARKIGAALSTQPGDNQNALAIAALRNAGGIAALGNIGFSSYLAQATAQVGEDAAQAGDAAAASQSLQSQLQTQRESISGVNLDEELSNLLRYQRAYQASAQVVNVANQILDDLLRLVP